MRWSVLSRDYIANLFIMITEAENIDQLWELFVNFCQKFDLSHGRVSIYELDVEIGPKALEHSRTFPVGPGSWGEHYVNNDLYIHDRSFHLIFEKRAEALEWTEMDRLTRRGTEANRVFVEMRNFGIGDGLLVGNSSLITKKTILLGLAGPSRVFKDFKKLHYRALVHCLQTFNNCYVELARREGYLIDQNLPELEMSERTREIVKLMSLDYGSSEIATKLGITENGLNQALKRLRGASGMKTRTGIVARALRARKIQ